MMDYYSDFDKGIEHIDKLIEQMKDLKSAGFEVQEKLDEAISLKIELISEYYGELLQMRHPERKEIFTEEDYRKAGLC